MAQPRPLTQEERLRWARAGVLGALAIVLGYLETFVPIPIPGIKLGLANIAVLIALSQGERMTAVAVAAIKVLASGLLFGNPVTMAYSAAGTALSLVVMLPLSRLKTLHLAMLSMAGAVAHEAGQLLVAQLILGTPLVWYSAPVLLVAAVACGALSGAVAARTATFVQASPTDSSEHLLTDAQGTNATPASAQSKALVVLFLVFVIVAFRVRGLTLPAVLTAASPAACALLHVDSSALLRALRPMLLILVITLVAQLVSLPPEKALKEAATMALRLASITAAGVAVATAIPREQVKDLARWILSPASALGANTDGPVLALDVAMRFVPVLAQMLKQTVAEKSLRLTDRALWTDVLPGVVADLYGRI